MIYRSKGIAVEAVAMMIALNPQVSVWNPYVTVFIAQSPDNKQTRDYTYSLKVLPK